MSPRPAIPEAEARAFLAGVAELPDPPPAVGYRSTAEAFAGALAEARAPGGPTTLEDLGVLVHAHGARCASGRHVLEVGWAWAERVRAVRLAQPSVMRRRGYAALAQLARGGA